MKTSNLLFLVVVLGFFTSSAFSACVGGAPSGNVTGSEECDAGVNAIGCTNECTVRNNFECTKPSGQASVCYELPTTDSKALFIQLDNLYFSKGRVKIAPAFNMTKINAGGLELPTITIEVGKRHLFKTLPKVDNSTGDIVFELYGNETELSGAIDYDLSIPLESAKKRDVSGTPATYTASFTAGFCPTEIKGTDPTLTATQPNKKLICVRSDFDSPFFYLKRVALRDSNEFQPGDAFDKGVLDCNCKYQRLFQ